MTTYNSTIKHITEYPARNKASSTPAGTPLGLMFIFTTATFQSTQHTASTKHPTSYISQTKN